MYKVSTQEARRTLQSNGRRKRRKDKPLPCELQVHPKAKSTRGQHSKATLPASGLAAMWKVSGQQPPPSDELGRYAVVWGGTEYRRYNDVVVAVACKQWLKVKGFTSEVKELIA